MTTRAHHFAPVFRLGGRRWRVRWRNVGLWAFVRWDLRRHEQGSVLRLWAGPLLVVALID